MNILLKTDKMCLSVFGGWYASLRMNQNIDKHFEQFHIIISMVV